MDITVLDPKIYPELADPEVLAMLQAFYSRSSKPIKDRLELFTDETNFGIKQSLNNYVVQYGHTSIADCGDLVIAIEGVSLLGAKVIQDSQLYNGQESSTRYITFEDRELYTPLDEESDELKDIQVKWLEYYTYLKPLVFEHLKNQFSYNNESSQYTKALNARTFDIIRSFLPLGCTTQLSWKGSLREINKRLILMLVHPLDEIRNFSNSALIKLNEIYPHTFVYSNPNDYFTCRKWGNILDFYKTQSLQYNFDCANYFEEEFTYQYIRYNKFTDVSIDSLFHDTFLKLRTPDIECPNFISQAGTFEFKFKLDYGSFRDVQRHRNGICRLPLISSNKFHDWYLDQLPPSIIEQTKDFILEQYNRIEKIDIEHIKKQYLYPIGTIVDIVAHYGLAEAIYVSELRSKTTVHPTLRNIAKKMGDSIKKEYPDISLFIDYAEDSLSLKRGSQDIILKE